jgi:hypothetical protein
MTHELRDHVEQDIALRIVELLCLVLCASLSCISLLSLSPSVDSPR